MALCSVISVDLLNLLKPHWMLTRVAVRSQTSAKKSTTCERARFCAHQSSVFNIEIRYTVENSRQPSSSERHTLLDYDYLLSFTMSRAVL